MDLVVLEVSAASIPLAIAHVQRLARQGPYHFAVAIGEAQEQATPWMDAVVLSDWLRWAGSEIPNFWGTIGAVKNMNAKELAKSLGYGYMTEAEVDCLHRLAALVPANAKATIINIGAGAGTSGLAFREGNQLARIVTIDIHLNSPLGSLQSESNAFRQAGKEPPEQIQSGSIRVGQLWDRGKVDLVYVDGDHSEEGVRGDIEAWLPHIKPGGYIAFHDYAGEPHHWPAVQQVVNELIAPRYPKVDEANRIVAFRVMEKAQLVKRAATVKPVTTVKPAARKAKK